MLYCMFDLKHYIWLVGLSALAFWQLPLLTGWPLNVRVLINFFPYVLIVFGVFLSLFMNRLLPILILLTLGVLNLAVSFYYTSGNAVDSDLTLLIILPVLTILLPINLLVWTWLPEKGLHRHSYSLLLLSLFSAQWIGLYFLMESFPIHWVSLLNQGIEIEGLNISIVAGVTIIVSWLLMVLKNAYLGDIRVIDRAIIFILLLMSVAFNQLAEPYAFAWLSSISVLLVVISIVFDSHQIAYTDELTRLKGRRALMESFQGLGRKYALAMMDIDHFKKFNDTYGHDVGDDVLVLVAKTLSKISVGTPYRYGGEEFVVVFPRKNAAEVKEALEAVRLNIEALVLNVKAEGKQKPPKVTVSFGLAEKIAEYKNAEAVMKAADEALYAAKKAGRNQIKLAEG